MHHLSFFYKSSQMNLCQWHKFLHYFYWFLVLRFFLLEWCMKEDWNFYQLSQKCRLKDVFAIFGKWWILYQILAGQRNYQWCFHPMTLKGEHDNENVWNLTGLLKSPSPSSHSSPPMKPLLCSHFACCTGLWGTAELCTGQSYEPGFG